MACFRLGTRGNLSKKKEVTIMDFNDYGQVKPHLFVDVVRHEAESARSKVDGISSEAFFGGGFDFIWCCCLV